ncbi:hypothetical protein ACQCSX_20745 [Pseudarthrobacter sp. P1]|uniref:hypothetical protein n=1 Tax=Pseudarthrobacter sp. P1 TaxID=3418418 RepID=UPI003CF7AC7B
MGAELAVTAANKGTVGLNGFNDTLLVKIKLPAPGTCVVLGRAMVRNHDSDPQFMSGKILHQANVEIDRLEVYSDGGDRICMALQGTVNAEENELVTLECNTYKGDASFGSLIAFLVDKLIVQ